MKLSILVVNWNSREYLRKCLKSIQDTCKFIAPQVVVVDGGSFDGCELMISAEFPEVIFVQAADNIGFGRSNNLGFERVTGDVVLLLNPDTELYDGAVQILLDQLTNLPSAGIVGSRLLNSDGSIQSGSIHVLPTPLTEIFSSELMRRCIPKSRLGGNAIALNTTVPLKVEAIGGACMMMRSDLFRRVGGFTNRYFMYAEDMDLCFKVHQLGLAIYHVPAARVIHHGGGSSQSQFSKFSTVMMREALYTYMVLNHGRLTAFQYRFGMFVSALVRICAIFPRSIVVTGNARQRHRTSLHKWRTILRWSLGMEPWARSYGKLVPNPEEALSNSAKALPM